MALLLLPVADEKGYAKNGIETETNGITKKQERRKKEKE